jgi:glutathione reductase (NADPH)
MERIICRGLNGCRYLKMDAENTYDLIVIGTGNAGTAMSLEALREGWRVAIVDELQFGGTCALKGGVPKKVLTGAADLTVLAKNMRNKGIDGDIRIKWHELMSFKRTFTDPIPLKRSRMYAERGLDTYNGHARFLGRNTLLAGDKIPVHRHCDWCRPPETRNSR